MENNSIQQAGSKLQIKLDSLKQQTESMSERESILHQSTKNAPELLNSLLMQREKIERRTIKNAIRRKTIKYLKAYMIVLSFILLIASLSILSIIVIPAWKAILIPSVKTMEMTDGKIYEIFNFRNMTRCEINKTIELCREKQ